MMNLFRDGMTFADFWTVDIKKKESDDKSTDLVSWFRPKRTGKGCFLSEA